MNTLKPLIVNSKNYIHFIQQADILYVKADGTYTYIILAGEGKDVNASKPLNLILKELNSAFFLKISQSYYVNRNYIAGVNKKLKMVLLTNGDTLKYTIKVNEFMENFASESI